MNETTPDDNQNTSSGQKVNMLTNAPPIKSRPVPVRCRADARKLLARVISAYQAGRITAENARVLAYLTQVFVSVSKEVETDDMLERIVALEKNLKARSVGIQRG